MITNKLLWGLGIPIHPSSIVLDAYLCRTSFKEGLYITLISVRLDLWSLEDVYRHLVWWIRRFRYLEYEKLKCWNAEWKYIFPTSRSNPDTRSPSGSTISLGVHANWRVQKYPPWVNLCYLYFCSTLTSIIFNYI